MYATSECSSSTKRKLLFFIILHVYFLWNIRSVETARILGLFASPAASHNIMFQALMKTLSERGHSVVVASPYPLRPPIPLNYTNVVLSVPNVDRKSLLKSIVSPNNTPLNEHLSLWTLAESYCNTYLTSSQLLKYKSQDDKSPRFDLVIVEVFFYDCLIGFAHHFDVPIIAMVSQFALPWSNDLVANPNFYSFVPNIFSPYGQRMNFFERLHNTIFSIGVKLYRRYVSLPKQTEIARKFFGSNMPPLWEIEARTSLVLTNGHPVISPIHPTMPNMIEVAGMHILATPPILPKEIQLIMDKQEKVILFSLGSVIDGNNIEEERLVTLMRALKDFPCQVLWKWNGEVDKLPLSLPANVYISKWLPQQSLLAHPNLIGFVTHGGLLSLQEATYYGVPIVGFPFFGDQHMNLKHAVEVGLGISLNFHTFRKDELVDAVRNIINNPFYSNNAKKLSSIFRDQPQTPLERGVYWTEYVLRHKGAFHLHSAATDLTWFQYYLIDVIAFLLIAMILMLLLLIKLWIGAYTLLFGRKKKLKEN